MFSLVNFKYDKYTVEIRTFKIIQRSKDSNRSFFGRFPVLQNLTYFLDTFILLFSIFLHPASEEVLKHINSQNNSDNKSFCN